MNGIKYSFATAFLCVSFSAHAQIPVTDVASIALDTANQVQTMAQWASQLTEMKTQYDQMTRDYSLAQDHYGAITGNRGLGSVNYDSSITGAIADPSSMWKSNSETQSIIADERLSGNAASMQESIEARSLQAAASQKAASLSAFQGAKRRLSQIEQLMGQISNTEDEKAIQEIQARIQIEQAALANEQSRHQINMQAASAEAALIQEQKAEFSRKILDSSLSAMPSIK